MKQMMSNGDEQINVTDISVIASHIKGISPLTDEQAKAADVNDDGDVNITNISLISAHIRGIRSF